MARRRKLSALPALAIFLLLHGVFFHDVVFGGRSLSASTLVAGVTPAGPVDAPLVPTESHLLDAEGAAWVDEPSPYLAHSALAAGELPLWNARTGLGAPLAANLNSGAGNPLQLPLDLWPSPLAADAFYLGRLLVLACGTWMLLRGLGLGTLAAVVGASVAAYGGYPMAWIAHHPLSSEIFLPFMLLGFERGRGGGSAGWVGLVLASAAALLGGKLQAAMLCFAFVAAWACVRATPGQGGRARSTVACLMAGFVLAAVAAAYLLLPAYEVIARASGLTLGGRSQLAGFTVPWPSLASIVVPELFVAPGRSFADGLLTPAIGVVALALAVVGARADGAPLRAIARLCVLWAAISLLRNVGVFGDLATRLPVLRGVLFVKYTFTAVFALALAAAIGLDAVGTGRVEPGRARRTIVAVLLACALVAALATAVVVPTYPARLAAPVAVAGAVLCVTGLWRVGRLGRGAVAVTFALAALAELWSFAPHRHPPRVDPYRAPAYVDFLRGAPPGRVIADADLLVPLTSAASGLADVRAIDVLTPGAYYAFFTRLVSFCDRVIHFTVDPDLALAATSPALDLVGVRWIVTRRPLALGDLDGRVAKQVGRERTARLLAGLERLRTEGAPFEIGPVAVGADERFAFTLTTPFTLDVTAESEGAELAWGMLVRGGDIGVVLTTTVDGVPSDAPTEPQTVVAREAWQERHVTLADAGARRRVRLRLAATSRGASPVRVSFGDLGFGPGAAVETRLARERTERHRGEAGALREAFRDPTLGVTIYENANALPRAFRVGRVEPTASEDAAFTRLGDGFDFRAIALIPKDDVSAVNAALANAAATGPDAGGTTTIEHDASTVVRIATDGPGAAIVVLADLAFPGWQAELDGNAAAVHTVDGLLRGVVVPAGHHVVEFRYRPASLLAGVIVSLLGLVALVPYARLAARRHRAGAVA